MVDAAAIGLMFLYKMESFACCKYVEKNPCMSTLYLSLSIIFKEVLGTTLTRTHDYAFNIEISYLGSEKPISKISREEWNYSKKNN